MHTNLKQINLLNLNKIFGDVFILLQFEYWVELHSRSSYMNFRIIQ